MTVYNSDINKLYNSLISDYLSKGYIVSPTLIGRYRCGTSSRCTNSIELVNPKIKDKVIRIFIDDDERLEHIGSLSTYVGYMHIYVKQYSYTKEDRKNSKQLWFDDGDLILDKKYYHIPDSSAFTETLDELAIIYMIRENRKKQKHESKQKEQVFKWINLSNLKPETIDSIMARINRMHGFKLATASCIQKIGIHKTLSYNYNLRYDVPRIESIVYINYKSKQTQIYLR